MISFSDLNYFTFFFQCQYLFQCQYKCFTDSVSLFSTGFVFNANFVFGCQILKSPFWLHSRLGQGLLQRRQLHVISAVKGRYLQV